MAGISLAEAAALARRSKPGLLKAINSGRLSATKNDLGQYVIDPAELERVFGKLADPNAPKPVSGKRIGGSDERLNATIKSVVESLVDGDEVVRLKERVTGLERERETLISERNHLRDALQSESTERKQITRLLTHQMEKEPEPPKRNWILPTTIIVAAAIIAAAIFVAVR